METHEEEYDSEMNMIKMDSDTCCNVGKGDHDTSCGLVSGWCNGTDSADLEILVTKTQQINLDSCPNFSKNCDGFQTSKVRSYQSLRLDLIEGPMKQLQIRDTSDLTMEWVGPEGF